MANFPTKATGLSRGESPSKYGEEEEDISIRSETEGGYEFRRPRFTRKPRTVYTTGFIGLNQSDYLALKSFYDTHKTTMAFNWTNQLTSVVHQVYFNKPIKWDYTGVATNRIWSCTIEMKEI